MNFNKRVAGAVEVIAEMQVQNNPDLAVVDSTRVRGGAFAVATLTERDALPMDLRKADVTRCWVAETATEYVLRSGIENAHWQPSRAESSEEALRYTPDPARTDVVAMYQEAPTLLDAEGRGKLRLMLDRLTGKVATGLASLQMSLAGLYTALGFKADAQAVSQQLANKADLRAGHVPIEQLPLATETTPGIVREATQAEALQGTLDGLSMTPYQVRQAIDGAIAALVAHSPAALDTLRELADALGDDPNFAATVTSQLGAKVNVADIVNDLATASSGQPLSAKQGMVLKTLYDALASAVHAKASGDNVLPLQGNTLGYTLSDLGFLRIGGGPNQGTREIRIIADGISGNVTIGGAEPDGGGYTQGYLKFKSHNTIVEKANNSKTFAGIVYAEDYSAGFHSRSLIDQGYARATFLALTGNGAGNRMTGSIVFADGQGITHVVPGTLTIGAPGGTTRLKSDAIFIDGLIAGNLGFVDSGPKSISFASGGGDNKGLYAQGDQVRLFYVQGGTNERSSLEVGIDPATGRHFIRVYSQNPVFPGMTYAYDYSGNYTPRSLVDWGYTESRYLRKDSRTDATTWLSGQGRWFCPFQTGVAALTEGTGLPGHLLRAIPFALYADIRVTDLAMFLIGGGSVGNTQFRWGIYAAEAGTAAPAALLYDSGGRTVTEVGAAFQQSDLLLSLKAGIYYFTVLTDAGAGNDLIFRAVPATQQQWVLGYATPQATTPVTRLEIAHPFASGLPTRFPGGYAEVAGAGFNPECLFIKSDPA